MSAKTSMLSPTTRLIGHRPPSSSGCTSSMAMAGYVSSGGSDAVAAVARVACLVVAIGRRSSPSGPFGAWAGVVLAFRERARTLLPFEGFGSIVTTARGYPMTQAPTRQTETPTSLLTDFDIYLFNEGTHVRLYEKLGAHVAAVDGKAGVAFGVWAPNADAVSVIGDFNRWDPSATPLHPRQSSGIWEGFVPDLGQ